MAQYQSPPHCRYSEAALPWLYAKGGFTGEMSEALGVVNDPEVEGLSANTVARLTQQWVEEPLN